MECDGNLFHTCFSVRKILFSLFISLSFSVSDSVTFPKFSICVSRMLTLAGLMTLSGSAILHSAHLSGIDIICAKARGRRTGADELDAARTSKKKR